MLVDDLSGSATEAADRVAIYELIQRERAARDLQRWDELASHYAADSEIDISWFKGSGQEFVAASRKMVGGGLQSFHQMGPTVVELRGDRALTETGCAIHLIGRIEGIEVDVTGHSRLYSRVRKVAGRWLMAGFRVLYISDAMTPLDPTKAPCLDQGRLSSYRSSYRFISYMLAESGHAPRPDLPGIDLNETTQTLWNAEQQWLISGPSYSAS